MLFLANIGNNAYLCTRIAVKTAAKLQLIIISTKNSENFIPILCNI